MIKTLIIILQAVIILCGVFFVWDYVTTKIQDHEKRLLAMEREARPLFLVHKYSNVYLNGEKISWSDELD